MDDWDRTFDTGKLRLAILEARQRIHAAIRLDEIELFSDSFSAIGGRFDRRIVITDAEYDQTGRELLSREAEWLRGKGYPLKAVRAELEPSFVLVDDLLYLSEFPIRTVPVLDPGAVARFKAAFDRIVEFSSVELPPYIVSNDEYFDEYRWFPVPLTTPARYVPRLGRHGNDSTQLLLRLHDAVRRRASDEVSLRWWSLFVRARDQYQCVVCGDTKRLAAHHISRKVLWTEARFMTGNGITLCRECHTEAHEGFNGRPDLQQSMDAEGGEKIELLAQLYSQLAKASSGRHPDDYFLGPQVLAKFKIAQGYA